MKYPLFLRRLPAAALLLGAIIPVHAGFRDDFTTLNLADNLNAPSGWSYFTGDGQATINFVPGPGYASIQVDATHDQRGIWWALIRHQVSQDLDLAQLSHPGSALRITARVRTNAAPRRVNLHANTQRTTDFHSNLREYYLPEANTWYTLSLTLPGFDAKPGDRVFAQLALMDWGLKRYQVDIDYFEVAVVDAATAGPDLGEPLEYRPPLANPASFAHIVPVAQDAMVDLQYHDMNFNDWAVETADSARPVMAADASAYPILRWDLSAFAGKKVAGSGLLEITTYALQRRREDVKDFGQVRVTEILGGDPLWVESNVTLDSLCQGKPIEEVINPQMIIDVEITHAPGGRTYATIPRPVMQRLLDGQTRGIAIRPLGAVNAAFYSRESGDPGAVAKLYFNVEH